MTDIALVFASTAEKDPKKIFKPYLQEEFDVFYLCSDKKDKILKKDIDLDFSKLDDYKIVCPVGAEPLKYVVGITGITKYNGVFIENKYFPLIHPKLVEFKPQYSQDINNACKKLINIDTDNLSLDKTEKNYQYIERVEDLKELIPYLAKAEYLVCDIETSALSPKRGEILGVGFATKIHEGIYIAASIINKVKEPLQNIFNMKKVIFHNGKFDMQWLQEEFNFEFPHFEDTILMHYCLEEAVGTHGLKPLALKFTDLGDYERELDDYKKSFCRKNKILLKDFNYGMLPHDILAPYAMKDCDGTAQLFEKFVPLINNNEKFNRLYNKLLKPYTIALMELEKNGGPVDREAAIELYADYQIDIEECINELKLDPDVARFERIYGKDFNPNSVAQLRNLFFELKQLKPFKKTAGGAWSVDKEVLAELEDPTAVLITELREKTKMAGTYLENILRGIDKDGRLRSSFNIIGTTSGRLSSSGTLNYQNIPRENKDIKKLFKARPGYKIVQADLGTAEVYYAAVLSKDKFLQQAFIDGLDFHGYIAKQMFNLPCEVDCIKGHPHYDKFRQYAKAITFGIMYQAGPAKIAETVNNTPEMLEEDMITIDQARNFIKKYFKEAKSLKLYIDQSNAFITNHAYIYSAFGRKRRLPESRASNRGVSTHAIRSGVNFLVQSVASDINLLGLVDLIEWIKNSNLSSAIVPFTVVHDSIVAEVADEYIDIWCEKIREFVQTDRGLSIKNCPIGVDIEVGYSWGEVIAIKKGESWRDKIAR
jgi:DNA polymerase I-like protein with 3'-5' exonuclease and polymerase domains